ncbi:TPA: glycosyltransferase family 2 protein [Candidatus Ventrenecus avicola]|nr:glycosyltransferase family 2 protein [Candidatus Ventrenecus avicola]
MNELISIIIPLYNCEKTVERCLNSIIHQTYQSYEIICINDGSVDKTEQVCKKFCAKHHLEEKMQTISMENSGVSAARNKGIKVSNGKYIAFIDGDDTIEPEFLEVLYNNIKQKKADISCCNINFIYQDSQQQPYKIYKRELNQSEYYYSLLAEVRGFCWNKLYLKKLFNHVAFNSNISIGEDFLMNVELGKNVHFVVATEKCLYNYYQNPNSAYNYSYSKKNVTEIDSYDMIIAQVKSHSPENLIYYKLEYCKIMSHQLYKYKKSDFKNEKVKERICQSKKKYLKEVMKSSQISMKEKVYLFMLEYCYPVYKWLKLIKRKL